MELNDPIPIKIDTKTIWSIFRLLLAELKKLLGPYQLQVGEALSLTFSATSAPKALSYVFCKSNLNSCGILLPGFSRFTEIKPIETAKAVVPIYISMF